MGIVSTFVSSHTGTSMPGVLAFDNNGNLYVANYGWNEISIIDPDGNVSIVSDRNGPISAEPLGFAFDKSGTNLYFSNSLKQGAIQKLSIYGGLTTFCDSGLSNPSYLAFDKSDNLYVSDNGSYLSEISSNSKLINRFDSVFRTTGIAFDSSGSLYVGDYFYDNISKISFNSLPITLSSFIATANNKIIQTNWHTSTELNTSHFIIQRSTDGISFSDIGTVKAIGSGANGYEFTDHNPANGINYYRLQSVDKDGASTYSKVVSVNFGDKQSFSIIPNPAKDFATISFSKKVVDKATIVVYDITGKAVITQSLSGTNSYKLNTQTLTNGVYVIRVNTANGSCNEKLLINK